jgi:glycine cleavage system H protein
MDGFTYHNLFETKGIEYIAIIGFFLVLIPFWIILNRPRTAKRIRQAAGKLTAGMIRIPHGLFFSRNHTWTHLEKTGLAKIGLDDLLMHITGEVKFKSLRQPGEKISRGDLIAEMDNTGKCLKVFSPVSGEIMETNAFLTVSPYYVSDDPYSKGWMYKVRPSDWKNETNHYFLAGEASVWISNELARFKDFIAESLAKHSPDPQIAYQDGGEVQDNTLSNLPVEVWEEFQEKFLS